jgi:fatty acid CoA ligase FadD9
LNALHEAIKSREAQQLQGVHRLAKERPPIDVLLLAVQTVLGSPAEAISPDMHFRDLGGDSLSAVTLSTLLSEAFGVPIPVDLIISPAYDLNHISEQIEKKIGQGSLRPTADKIHGFDATVFRSSDLMLENFLPSALLAQNAAPPPSSAGVKTILLTGATGFLGRFLALDILERIEREGGKLICLVRGRDSETGRERLINAFGESNNALREKFQSLSHNLEIVTGDISDELLGLDDTTWARLAEEVDSIIHTGALVNHLLPYASLFDANVNSTAELIRLALTHHQKPISFMSSIAVSTLLGERPEQALDEDQDIRTWGAVVSADDTYAAGYGLTKWASEVLLREANERAGLPVTVYRSSMILAHQHEPGQLNIPDMFTRLLFSIAETGIAPRSFYQSSESEPGEKAHYDGLPVNFTSAAIVKVSLDKTPSGYRSFNLVNHHDDGVSLDSFVGWMKESGVELAIIDDYAIWVQRIEQSMRDLPERLRAHSILPLLHGLATPIAVQRGSSIPSGNLQMALTQGSNHPFEVPRIDRALIARYIVDLESFRLTQARNFISI